MATATQRDDATRGELAGIDAQTAEVAAELVDVKGKIARVEAALNGGEPRLYLGRERSVDYLDQRLVALEKQLEQLRETYTELQRQKTALLAPQQPADPSLLQEILDGVQALKAANEEAQSMRVSDMTSHRKCQRWMESLQLDIKIHPTDGLSIAGVDIKPEASVAAFTWSPEPEPSSKQRYMDYLGRLIPLPRGEAWLDCSSKSDLLTVAGGRVLPFTISGTSDVAVCSEGALKSHVPSSGLRLVIELKKPSNMGPAATFQAATQLVLANVHAPSRRPVVVLTDLGKMWTVLWMGDSDVMGWNLSGAEAIAVLRRMIRDESVSLDGTVTWSAEVGDGAFYSLVSRSVPWQHPPGVLGGVGGEGSLSARLAELGLEDPEGDDDVRKALAMEATRAVSAIPCFAPCAGSDELWRHMFS